MSRICLDSSALSDAIRDVPEALAAIRKLEQDGATMVTTTHNVFEASVGALRVASPEGQRRLFARLRRMLDNLEIVYFDLDAALDSAKLLVALYARGRPPGAMDLLTAATARRGGCTAILTRDADDFERMGVIPVVSY